MDFKKLITQGIIWRGFYFFSLLLVNVFLSRYLQAAATGNLYFITIIFSFLQVVLTMGMEAGILYFASSGKISRRHLMMITFCWSFMAGFIMMLLVRLYFLIDHSLPDNLAIPYAVFGFCFVSGMILMNFSTALFYTRENYMMPNMLLALVNLALVIIIPSKNSASPATVDNWVTYTYFSSFLVAGLVVISAFAYYTKQDSWTGWPDKTELNFFFKYAITALAGNVIFFLVYRIDYLFVHASPVSTDADLGNYIQVSKLGQMMLVLPQIIASVVFPQTAGGKKVDEIGKQIMILVRLFCQGYLLFLVIVLLTGDFIFTSVFGETFNAMKWPMILLIPGILAISILAMLSAYFAGHGQVKYNVQGAALALVVMITGDFIFVPVYGIIAAAIISSVSYISNLAYSMYRFKHYFNIHLSEFMQWRISDYNWMLAMFRKKDT